MTRANNIANQELEEKEGGQQPEVVTQPDNSDKLEKLAKLLKDKGVISETEYNLIFK
jgi:MoaA/NifB/PqqE/SkfB family radical SAM enzyme